MSRLVRLPSSANHFFWPLLDSFLGLRVSRLTEGVIKDLNHQLIALRIGREIRRSDDNATIHL